MNVTLSEMQENFAQTGIAVIRRIYTSATIPATFGPRDLPALLPDPAQPLGSLEASRLTIGGAGWVWRWTLNYACLVAEDGQGRNPADHAERMAECIQAVTAAFCDWLGPSHGQPAVTVGGAGTISDPSGKQFRGFPVSVTVVTSY